MALKSIFWVVKNFTLKTLTLKHSFKHVLVSFALKCCLLLWTACECFILLSGRAFRNDFRRCMWKTTNWPKILPIHLMCVLPSPFEAKTRFKLFIFFSFHNLFKLLFSFKFFLFKHSCFARLLHTFTCLGTHLTFSSSTFYIDFLSLSKSFGQGRSIIIRL